MFYGSILTCNFGDTVTTHCRACLLVPHLITDGYVSACDMALFGKKKGVCEAIRFLDSHMTENQRKYLYTHP